MTPRAKLLLVQLPAPRPSPFAASGNVPLAAGCLAVAAKVHGLDARLAVEIVPAQVTDLMGDTLLTEYIVAAQPDFLGLTLYMWNVERSLHLAGEVRRLSPKTGIVIGGPEVVEGNDLIESAPVYDFAVTGEGEGTATTLLSHLLAGREADELPGVFVRKDGASPPRVGGLRPLSPAAFALNRYASPYVAGLVAVEPDRAAYIETQRGCRFACAFCGYGRQNTAVRTLPLDDTVRLFRYLEESGSREVVFLDPSFNQRPDLDIFLDTLADINSDRQISLYAEIRGEILSTADARRMARAGFASVEVGLQSVSQKTRRSVGCGGDPNRVAEAAASLCNVGITPVVDLIVGLPDDTADDVARGIELLETHGLGGDAQVFLLSVLPGTQMRREANERGMIFDREPPYFVRRTPTMDESQMREALSAAEKQLDRDLDEPVRPFLVSDRDPAGPPDVFTYDLDRDVNSTAAALPGAQHVALWLHGRDIYQHRQRISRLIEARMAVDPFATLDVVLAPRMPFPLDLIDDVSAVLARGRQSYASRLHGWRGDNGHRRITVCLKKNTAFPDVYLCALRQRAAVFRNQSLVEAAAKAGSLGDDDPGARVIDPDVDDASTAWRTLAAHAEPEAVTFASRAAEAKWVQRVLGYR